MARADKNPLLLCSKQRNKNRTYIYQVLVLHSRTMRGRFFANSNFKLCPKSLHTFRSVWTKTTLNPGGVGRAGANPQTCKKGTFISKM